MELPRRHIQSPPSPEERKAGINAIKWRWFEMNGYPPHSAQKDVHLSNARFRIAIAGTRGGKSRCVGEEVVPYLLVGATRVWLIAQTYQLAEKEFRYVYDRMTDEPIRQWFGGDVIEKAVYDEKGGNMQIRTKWGSEVKCISLEKSAGAGAFGDEVDLIVLCEPAQIKEPKRVYERVLFGRLASRKGDLIIAGTPAGKTPKHDPDGWVNEMYEKGLSDDPDYYTRQWASWENPSFKDDPYWIRSWMNPLIFAEQYEGAFIVLSGAIFTSFDPLIHVLKPFKIPPSWNRYEGIDPGFSGMFYWCAGVTGYDGTLYIIDEYSDQKQTFLSRGNAIWEKRMSCYGLPFQSFKNADSNLNRSYWDRHQDSVPSSLTLYIDPEDPQFLTEIAQMGIAGIRANNDIHIGINRVNQRLQSSPINLYITSNCSQLITAMTHHSWGEKLSIDVRKPANDQYKHPCDTLRYICMGGLTASQQVDIVLNKHGIETLDDILEEMSRSYMANDYELDAYKRRVFANG